MNKNRAGYYKTNLTREAAYQSFVPSPLPPEPAIELDRDMTALLIKANAQIAALNEIAKHIPNMNLFVSMYVRKEALMSSQIEGTQATLEDVFDPMLETNRTRDVADVVNYIKATEYAIRRLETLPLCNRLLRETHAILIENVRGQERNPGEFRHSQNWIGGQGSTLKTARYIPPAPEDMDTAISVFHYLEANPIIDIGKTAEATGLSFNTVATAVKKLTDMNIVSQTNAAARNRTFAYTDYLDLLRDGT